MIKYNQHQVASPFELYLLTQTVFYNNHFKIGGDIWKIGLSTGSMGADILFFLDHFKDLIIEQEQINTIRELVNSKDKSNILIAFELIRNLNLKDESNNG